MAVLFRQSSRALQRVLLDHGRALRAVDRYVGNTRIHDRRRRRAAAGDGGDQASDGGSP
jgi:hypothetical protein